MMKLELDAPNLSAREKAYLHKTIDEGFVSTFGPYVGEFEARFARFVGSRHAVSTQSGTAALHISLYKLGIGKGDEVIVPTLTFIASVNPVVYVGATPVFADVDKDTWNIAPEEIEKRITKRTKAIIPVHFYGNPCRMDAIMKIARRYGIHVIEDATESLGAKFDQKFTGTFGDLGCFSFNGNKIITTGGGGMVVGQDARQMKHIKFLTNQARDESRGYYHSEVGFNYRMTNLEAAMGLAQMERIDEFLEKKHRSFRIYKKELGAIKGLHFQKEYKGADSSRWFTCAVFEGIKDITVLQRKLKDAGVPTRRVFTPITEFPPYKKLKTSEYRNSYYIYERGLCLPSSTLNSEDDIYLACGAIKKVLGA